jgi:uncharacterized protein (DUF924 family)
MDAKDPRAAQVLRYWFGQPRAAWFTRDAAFDAEIRARFLALYEQAAARGLEAWKQRPADCLALVIALDQFPRNMFRAGTPEAARAFAADSLALEAARHAVTWGFDRGMTPEERQFLYLPFEHSESLAEQLECCELMARLLPFQETAGVYRYALAHRAIIERFGRFPHRNAALGRASTAQEIEFLKQPGSAF